ncbi:hypothetical protein [Flavobacteriaceae bacterium 14752]|uniref:hypothetical protein n=1 Tax=Mesohalobacter salilacus TaxID=2491711 RepID=UPI000F62D7E8|nr:hypothetical protein EIG84_03730 [Flavobacteriaceae bacterium 14752]
MKYKLIIFFLLIFSTFYSQNIVIDISDKSDRSEKNPASEFKIIEPKTDTLSLSEQKIFSLIISHHGVLNSLHLIDYPNETYADLNNLKEPETNKDYLALSNKERKKFTVIVPKHEIIKEGFLSRRVILEIKITSDRITHTEIYADGKLIKTLYYQTE